MSLGVWALRQEAYQAFDSGARAMYYSNSSCVASGCESVFTRATGVFR